MYVEIKRTPEPDHKPDNFECRKVETKKKPSK